MIVLIALQIILLVIWYALPIALPEWLVFLPTIVWCAVLVFNLVLVPLAAFIIAVIGALISRRNRV